MSIHSNIRQALETHLSDANILPIAYENVPFDGTTNEEYLITEFIPTARRPAIRGLNPTQRYRGIFRVTVVTPIDTGPARGDEIADDILDLFDATTDIHFTNNQNETIHLPIEYSERSGSFIQSPNFLTPVSIGWYIFN